MTGKFWYYSVAEKWSNFGDTAVLLLLTEFLIQSYSYSGLTLLPPSQKSLCFDSAGIIAITDEEY